MPQIYGPHEPLWLPCRVIDHNIIRTIRTSPEYRRQAFCQGRLGIPRKTRRDDKLNKLSRNKFKYIKYIQYIDLLKRATRDQIGSTYHSPEVLAHLEWIYRVRRERTRIQARGSQLQATDRAPAFAASEAGVERQCRRITGRSKAPQRVRLWLYTRSDYPFLSFFIVFFRASHDVHSCLRVVCSSLVCPLLTVTLLRWRPIVLFNFRFAFSKCSSL